MTKFKINDPIIWIILPKNPPIDKPLYLSGTIIDINKTKLNSPFQDSSKPYLIQGINSPYSYWVNEADIKLDIEGMRDRKINEILNE